MATNNYIAVDLGASSGRVMLGRYDQSKVTLEEIHRFSNGPLEQDGSIYWDIHSLFNEVKKGLALAGQQVDGRIISIGVDSWGVDYGLLDTHDQLLSLPRHYRDPRTENTMSEVFEHVSQKDIFEETGLQFLPFNTLYQLVAAQRDEPNLLAQATSLLLIPDLINFWLTGKKAAEATISSTTQCYNPQTKKWVIQLLESLGLPTTIFANLIAPGTKLGPLTPAVAHELALEGVPVVAVGSHDTASAVAAVPAAEDNFAFLSSGTWSLLGTETAAPIIHNEILEHGFTNEAGVCDTTRILKNVNGLWLLQECQRVWASQGEKYSFAELVSMAHEADAFTAFIDPDDEKFMAPGDMPQAIRLYCKETEQPPPESKGSIVRVALESLALKYQQVLTSLETITKTSFEQLYIVGGGSQNELLNQLTANATQRKTLAGPIEATAFGNILMQMLTAGDISSLRQGREVVRRSCGIKEYLPRDTRGECAGNAW